MDNNKGAKFFWDTV